MNKFVKVVHGSDPIQNAYDAISAVCKEPVEGKTVLLKVNTRFKGEDRKSVV